jgi:hypothetical protein
MKKILFLHGFFASGQCVPAMALREAFQGKAEVLTPDLPMHPQEAVRFIRELCKHEKPDVLAGNSCGSFYAQMIASELSIPALLGNPHFNSYHFPGAHTPTAEEISTWYVPLIEKVVSKPRPRP